MRASSVVGLTIGGLAITAGVAIGGYHLSWWLKEERVNRNAAINQDSYSRQNALVEQILDDIVEAEDPNLPAPQRIAIVDQICDSAAKVTGTVDLPSSAWSFIAKECP